MKLFISFWCNSNSIYLKIICAFLPVMCGGSMVFGPKNDGISLDVVTGVFKSPVCASAIECDWCSVFELLSIWFVWCDGWLLSVLLLLLLALIQLMLQLMPGDVLVLLFIVNKLLLLLLFANDVVVVAADFKRQVSKLNTLKCAAAADSVRRNAWCDGATSVSNPSMIMVVVGCPGAGLPESVQLIATQ